MPALPGATRTRTSRRRPEHHRIPGQRMSDALISSLRKIAAKSVLRCQWQMFLGLFSSSSSSLFLSLSLSGVESKCSKVVRFYFCTLFCSCCCCCCCFLLLLSFCPPLFYFPLSFLSFFPFFLFPSLSLYGWTAGLNSPQQPQQKECNRPNEN